LVVKARLAIVAAVGGLALAGAPGALADPNPLAPVEGALFTARVDQITFQASTALSPSPSRIDFYISRGPETDSHGMLSDPIDSFYARPDGGTPPVYEAEPGSDASWPNKPRPYYWQARYHNCGRADPNCFSPIRSLTINPLPPPTQISPADGATIPYGGQTTFSVRGAPSYTREGTRLYIEFSKGTELAPDGTFADRYLLARPTSAGGSAYEYQFTRPFTRTPGTYYWMVERFDCGAEADCYVTDNQIRSFTVAPWAARRAPNTIFTRHPARRTHKRKVRFAFSSNVPGASFQCFYTGGWSPCRSPQKFRHLKPGRYRFKARAVANGKKDPTPASWLFKVVRRHRGRH
jgi:hypothetical protein